MVAHRLLRILASPWRLGAVLFSFWLLVLSFHQWWSLREQPGTRWIDLWVTADQQGQWYFSRGQYQLAAQRFEDISWKATAYYAAENFSAAEELWSRESGYLPLFHRANALAHLERYKDAADSYRLSLKLNPEFQPAKINLELVEVLGKKPKEATDFSSGKEARLDADDIVFDEDSERMKQAEETQVLDSGDISSEEVQALWMRRLQSKPVDFLRLKFRYQQQEEVADDNSVQPSRGGSTP